MPQRISSVRVTRLECSGMDIPLPGTPSHQQKSQSMQSSAAAASSGAAGSGLLLVTEVDAVRHQYVADLAAVEHGRRWAAAARAAAADAGIKVLPGILSRLLGLEVLQRDSGLGARVHVWHLPTVVTVSETVPSPAAGEAGYVRVTRTTTDAVTGEVLNTQSINVPVAEGVDGRDARQPGTANDDSGAEGNDRQGGSKPNDNKGPGRSDGQGESTPTGTSPTPTPPGDDDSSTSKNDPRPGDAGAAGGISDGCTLANCSMPNAVPSCVHGQCHMQRCLAGWQDCDTTPDNGCEVSSLGYFTDNNNCGGCGNVCLLPLTCVFGKCAAPGNATATENGGMEEQTVPSEGTDSAAEAQLPGLPFLPSLSHMPQPYDDIAFATPDQTELVLDVLENDNLARNTPAELQIKLVQGLDVGTGAADVSVLPGSSDTQGALGRPRLQLRLAAPLAPGEELSLAYTLAAPGRLEASAAQVQVFGTGAGNSYRMCIR
jgi:hypothetical protein